MSGTLLIGGNCGADFLTGLAYGGTSSSSYCGGSSAGRLLSLSLPLEPWVALGVRASGSLPLLLDVYGVSMGGLSESVVRTDPALAFLPC